MSTPRRSPFIDTAAVHNRSSSGPRDARDRKCRLFYVIGQLVEGGSERQLYYLLRALDRERYKPVVAVWNYSGDDIYVQPIESLGVPVFSLGSGTSRSARLRALRTLIRRYRPELVHSYSFFTNFVAEMAAWSTGAIAVGSLRSDFTWARMECGALTGSLNAMRPRHQIWNSEAAIEAVRRSGRFFVPDHIHLVSNGIDLAYFRRTALDASTPVQLLGVGSLVPVKRWDILLEAARELKRSGVDCQIRIAGAGRLHNALNQLAARLGVDDRVHFVGHRDDIAELLAQSTALVHTAESEGCPNAVMEAMACGRAVVAMGAGAISSLVEDGVTGYVVPHRETSSFAARLVEICVNRASSRRMGQLARLKAEREFGLNRMVAETMAAYRNAGWIDDGDVATSAANRPTSSSRAGVGTTAISLD